jgi:hypothetical protein
MFLRISISWPLPTETCVEISRFVVEQDVPSSPDDFHRRPPDPSEGLGAQGHHRMCRNVEDCLKCLGLLAVNRAVKEWPAPTRSYGWHAGMLGIVY